MSFSENTKQEIAAQRLHSRREKTAFLSALIHTAGSLIFGGGRMQLVLYTENAQVREAVDAITAEIYKTQAAVRGGRRMELVYEGAVLPRLLKDCGIIDANGHVAAGIAADLIATERCGAAYVRGAFLGAGSVTAQRYHLEFVLSNALFAEDLVTLLAKQNIPAKVTARKEKYVVYLKEGEAIADCLALMGASKAVLSLCNLMAERQLGGYVNRATNCEMHNLDKQVQASVLQTTAIRHLLAIGAIEDARLRETALVRLENPEASYEELAASLKISKSGVKHRLRRLLALAESKNILGEERE